jgi:hypothetical protein
MFIKIFIFAPLEFYMKKLIFILLIYTFLGGYLPCRAQYVPTKTWTDAGVVSLGVRNSLRIFGQGGFGLGTGAQFRVLVSPRFNTEWFVDYLTLQVNDRVKSEHVQYGGSLLYYPTMEPVVLKGWKPYLVGGYCLDYNRHSEILYGYNNKARWGSALQAGLGAHVPFGERFDLSINGQYMVYLGKQLSSKYDGTQLNFFLEKSSGLRGHFFTSISLNYKIIKGIKG